VSVLSAIRAKCLDCCAEHPSLVRECELTHCALHPYRMGTNPFRKKRELSDEQRAALAERLAAGRRSASPEFEEETDDA
jgi:hypothetical protein